MVRQSLGEMFPELIWRMETFLPQNRACPVESNINSTFNN